MLTVKSGDDITRIFERGKRFKTRDLVFIVLQDDEQHGHEGRVAFIAGKKQGNAVWRNRAKRRMREACRLTGGPLPSCDTVFLATRTTTRVDFSELVEQVEKMRDRFGIDKI